jgi:hypothetical protein
MITLESGGMSHSKKIAYSISKIPIPQNERKQTGPKKKFGDSSRAFQQAWYKKFDWLEYSVSKDVAFCFYCFLFKEQEGQDFMDLMYLIN